MLWLKWSFVRAARAYPQPPPTRHQLDLPWAGWYVPLALVALLIGRAVIYWQLGSAIDWVPRLTFGSVVVSFRSDFPGRAFLFSALSFAKTLGTAWTWMVFLSLINGRVEDEPWQRHVTWLLGPIARWPAAVRLLLPWVGATAAWLALELLLHRAGLVPAPASPAERFQKAATIGLTSYLSWKYLVVGALSLYLVSNYIYLGANSFWGFIALTGRNLVRPLSRVPLRIARVDLAPALVATAVFLAAEFAEHRLTALYARLPF